MFEKAKSFIHVFLFARTFVSYMMLNKLSNSQQQQFGEKVLLKDLSYFLEGFVLHIQFHITKRKQYNQFRQCILG